MGSGRGRNAFNDAEQLAAKDWRARAIALRRQHFTIREIAKKVDRSPSLVGKVIKEAIEAIPVEDLEQLRKEQAEKIVRLQRAHRKLALIGDKDASEVYLKALAAERQLLGLNAPEKRDVTVNANDASLLARIAALAVTAEAGDGDSAAEPGGEGTPSDDAGGEGAAS